ncbi:DUF3617 domain-containing protein [Asticcacaulis endophyticus]|uniref:DUF3617 family protein n=1 Tax=Asticcacaulis endophyticus TaxID=1395890 RepID=A0A918PZV0_9CAUL|nr:DUF3617 family protein [Asticcacaulis endophyticus]GGZ29120.1 hypothetical protein GCM10011273_13860 [Asticcacaulis endophyticus]
MRVSSKDFASTVISTAIGVAVLLALSACGKKEEAPPPAPAPVVEAPKPPPMEPMPARKPGLWETAYSEEGSDGVAPVMKICIDAETDKHLGITGNDLSGDKCTKTAVSRMEDEDGKPYWAMIAECDMGSGGKTEINGKFIGDYTSNYTFTARSQTTGAALEHMNRVVNITVKSRRIGACPSSMKGGDVIMPGDVKMNLFDMSVVPPEGQ